MVCTEEERLEALDSLELLDSPREVDFDELVQLAAAICGTPIALFSLVAKDRQWFKASIGIGVEGTPREISFCTVAIQTPSDMMIVEDALQDRRFATSPLVTGDPNVRFYAGMPIEAPGGEPVGTLCIIDTVPRQLTRDQQDALRILSKQIKARMELRAQRNALQRVLAANEKITAKLRTSQDRFEAFMSNSPFMSFMKDENGRFVYYNQRLADEFGIDKRIWLGRSDHDLFPAEVADVYRKNDLAVLRQDHPTVASETTVSADGSTRWWSSHKFPFQGADGQLMLGGVSVDVTEERSQRETIRHYQEELQEANRRLQQLAVTDPLTGLGNRRVLDERLKIEYAVSQRHPKQPLSALMIDIDNFKRRNDTYGHQHGDSVLRDFGAVIRSLVRRSDTAVRYGGEEMAILLPTTTEIGAEEFANRLLERMAATQWENGPVTVSIGIACTDAPMQNGDELIERADRALYGAKRAGKNCARRYSQLDLGQL